MLQSKHVIVPIKMPAMVSNIRFDESSLEKLQVLIILFFLAFSINSYMEMVITNARKEIIS